MAGLAVNDIIEVKVGTYCAGQTGINVLHYKVTAVSGLSAQVQEVADAMDTKFHLAYKAVMAANATYYGVSAQKIRPLPKSIAEVSATHTGQGNVGNSHAMPTQVSSILTKQSDFAGRANRGRVYVPFPGVIDNDPTLDRPTDEFVGDLNTLGARMEEEVVAGTAPDTCTLIPVIYDRVTHDTVVIVNLRANPKWATQRRRGNYGKPNPYPPF